jgi:hypothetical protein
MYFIEYELLGVNAEVGIWKTGYGIVFFVREATGTQRVSPVRGDGRPARNFPGSCWRQSGTTSDPIKPSGCVPTDDASQRAALRFLSVSSLLFLPS